ncbi:MAG: hypothetical protein PF482_19710 [Desulfobacteraceae bacterium]|jgi:DNA-directed RNA polymerase delta subunit|nr:hypothetical protein [Desulfobacteraceae bacterium]
MQNTQTLSGPHNPADRLGLIQAQRVILKARHQNSFQFRQIWSEIDGILAGQEAAALKDLRTNHV